MEGVGALAASDGADGGASPTYDSGGTEDSSKQSCGGTMVALESGNDKGLCSIPESDTCWCGCRYVRQEIILPPPDKTWWEPENRFYCTDCGDLRWVIDGKLQMIRKFVRRDY